MQYERRTHDDNLKNMCFEYYQKNIEKFDNKDCAEKLESLNSDLKIGFFDTDFTNIAPINQFDKLLYLFKVHTISF